VNRVPEAVALLGAILTLLSAVGVVRFTDVFERSHALTKAATVGLVLVLVAAAVELDNTNDATNLILAGILQVITMPVGANLMNATVYRAVGIPHRVDTVDELAERDRRRTAEHHPGSVQDR
jgi:multicomponent Na+:H+ antiporter subunit G